jgi:hypothetical protein
MALEFVVGAVTQKVVCRRLAVRACRQKLQKQPGIKRTVVIYGPDGEPTRTFDVDDPPRK